MTHENIAMEFPLWLYLPDLALCVNNTDVRVDRIR